MGDIRRPPSRLSDSCGLGTCLPFRHGPTECPWGSSDRPQTRTEIAGNTRLRRRFHRHCLLHVQPASCRVKGGALPGSVSSRADGAECLPHLHGVERLLNQGLQLRRRRSGPGIGWIFDRSRPRLHSSHVEGSPQNQPRDLFVCLALEPSGLDEGWRIDVGRIDAAEIPAAVRPVFFEVPAGLRGRGRSRAGRYAAK